MSGMTSLKFTPRQVTKVLPRILQAGLVPYIKSSPGMGKSAIVRKTAKDLRLKLIDIRLSTLAPTDLTGLPFFDQGKAQFMPFDIFPTANTPIPDGYDGWLIFFDEFSSAPKSVQAATYKVLLEKAVGNHDLHPHVVMVAAGNLATDRAIVNPLSTALESRVIHINMELNADEFLQDVAIAGGWDKRIISYLAYKPSMIHDFKPDHSNDTFCCPRTWEFVNKLITGYDYVETPDGEYPFMADGPLLAGAITSGVAMDFINFTRVFSSLPKISEILKDPANFSIPHDPKIRYATITHLLDKVDEDNLGKIADYINRFPSEFRVLFWRMIMRMRPQLRAHGAFRASLVELSKYLNDDA